MSNNFGRWGRVAAPERSGATKESATVKVNNPQGPQEFSSIETKDVGTPNAHQAFVSVRVTVGRSAAYGAEKLEASVECGLPCKPDAESRVIARNECLRFITESISETVGSARESFNFTNAFITDIVK